MENVGILLVNLLLIRKVIVVLWGDDSVFIGIIVFVRELLRSVIVGLIDWDRKMDCR
jgi:hypothetical protein